jgi:HTH-type transcriptional regulator, competence development regulator
MRFFDIEKWKHLSEEEIEEIIKHFEWVVHKAKEKNKQNTEY